MKKHITKGMNRVLALSMSILALTGCGAATTTPEVTPQKPAEEVELIVSAAASLKETMAELEVLFETANPSVKLTFTFGGSGTLQQQIEEGAPTDLFMSAALKQMTALEEGGFILEDTKKELLVNKVVLIVPKDKTDITRFDDLNTEQVSQLAIGEPGSVPVGQYTEEILATLGILESIKASGKVVYAKDVKEVLTWVETGNVDAGVVYATDALTSDSINIVCEAPEGSHKEVTYPVAVIKESTHPNEAKRFVDFLSTEEARTVFESYGFKMK